MSCNIACKTQIASYQREAEKIREVLGEGVGSGVSLYTAVKFLVEENKKLHDGICDGRDFEDFEIRRLSAENTELKAKLKKARSLSRRKSG